MVRGRDLAVVVLLSGLAACGAPHSTGDGEGSTSSGTAVVAAPAEQPVITVTLPGEPAAVYRAGGEDPATGSVARRIEAFFPGLRAIPCLERAAGIYGRTAQADRLPLSFSEFALHWSGCPDPSAAILNVLTDDDGDEALFDEISTTLESVPATHVGVAKVPANEPYRWRWTVLLVDRDVEMQPVPTGAVPGSSVALVIRFLRPVLGASVISTHPDGSIVDTGVGLSGDRMLAAVEIADRPGTQWIEVIATDESGPHVALLFPVEVGRDPPRAWIGQRRRDEAWLSDPVAAEGFAHELLDGDRVRFGLHSLIRNDVLDAVARRHSSEMARTGDVAHLSPTTGSVVDRLQSAGFDARFAAENIARASSISDAQEGLMRSPGHRAAILAIEATHVGIGVVTVNSAETGRVHFMTQVFARPTDPPTR